MFADDLYLYMELNHCDHGKCKVIDFKVYDSGVINYIEVEYPNGNTEVIGGSVSDVLTLVTHYSLPTTF